MVVINVFERGYIIAELGEGDVDPPFDLAGSGTGVVSTSMSGQTAYVVTGTDAGPVDVTIERLLGPPDRVATGWDEVAEVSVRSNQNPLRILHTWEGPVEHEPLVESSGDYRLRVSVRNRDAAREAGVAVLTTPVESHLLQVWPATRQPPTLLASKGDAVGLGLFSNSHRVGAVIDRC